MLTNGYEDSMGFPALAARAHHITQTCGYRPADHKFSFSPQQPRSEAGVRCSQDKSGQMETPITTVLIPILRLASFVARGK